MTERNALDRLKADLKNKTPGNFYVFHGTESYLRTYVVLPGLGTSRRARR